MPPRPLKRLIQTRPHMSTSWCGDIGIIQPKLRNIAFIVEDDSSAIMKAILRSLNGVH